MVQCSQKKLRKNLINRKKYQWQTVKRQEQKMFFLPAAGKQSKTTKNKRSFFTLVLANSHPVKDEKEPKKTFFSSLVLDHFGH
jgi:hypothetical protein